MAARAPWSMLAVIALFAGAAEAAEPKEAYFGDLHVHTRISKDSFSYDNPVTPEAAYDFGRGKAIKTYGGASLQLDRPLDFMAVTDHAESFAIYQGCVVETGAFAESEGCKEMHGGALGTLYRPGPEPYTFPTRRRPEECPGGTAEGCLEASDRVWQALRALADARYEPGVFTTFIAYEYSSILPSFGHDHRNIIFRGSDVTEHALSSIELQRPLDLWRWLDEACTGACEVLAIPHNMNFSWGQQFALRTQDGEPYSDADLALRARLEPLAEIFQIKGASECAVGIGTSDEECAFEQIMLQPCPSPDRMCAAEGSFLRNALKTGLALGAERSVNPYKLGIIAGTDTHSGTAGAVAEDAFHGSTAKQDFEAARRLFVGPNAPVTRSLLARNPGGLAGIWAAENTREALFDAMRAKETFGTSGPRIVVRFFGGWDMPPALDGTAEAVMAATAAGVPMGGDLARGSAGVRSTFLVRAEADPMSAPLFKLQIVKGWLDAAGEAQERVYDVACSDGLEPDGSAHCPDNGADVDLSDCSISTGKGAAALATRWSDPDFDPGRPAFYYVRVLENPTCRWSTYDAIALGRPPSPMIAPTVRERAWSSPIWYAPAAR